MLSRFARFLALHAHQLWRLLIIAMMVPLAVLLSAALALHFWVMPHIGEYHDEIVALASRAAGRPAVIGRIEADWEGIHPRLRFHDVRILDGQGRPLLDLPLAVNVLDWRTLFLGELRLRSLLLERPQLVVRRDAQGVIHIAGIPLAGGEGPGADWLLQQRRLEVREATLLWQDELLDKPPLPFEGVQFSLFNQGARHELSLHATPPAFLAAPLELTATLTGRSLQKLAEWHGQLNLHLAHFDALAWGQWFPLPEALSYARGSIAAAFLIERSGLRQLTLRGEMAGLQARLSPELPLLHALALRGELKLRELPRGYELSGKELSLELADGLVLPPGNYLYRHQAADMRNAAETELRADRFDLAWLPRLLTCLPVEDGWRAQLAEYAPQGVLQNLRLQWQGEVAAPQRYQLHAEASGLGLNAVGGLPGFTALNGTLDASERGGTLTLDAPGARFMWPNWLAEPLQFDTFVVQTNWQREQQGWAVKLSQARLENADLAGTVYGDYHRTPAGPGYADLSANLSRVEVRRAARYLPPRLLDAETHDWLRRGLLAGVADTLRLRLRGDLADFPFAGGKNGVFQLTAQARGVAIDYAPGWPRVEQAEAELRIDGAMLEVNSRRALVGGAAIQRARVRLPDMLAKHSHLLVEAEVAGPTRLPLAYINHSPLRAMFKDFTRDMRVSGDGRLALQLEVPLSGPEPVRVKGSYRFSDNTVELAPDIPTLSRVNGVLEFTEDGLAAKDVAAQIYGGPARLNVSTAADGRIVVQARGHVPMEGLHSLHPLARQLHGSTDWRCQVVVRDDDVGVDVDSDLHGITSDLPAPLAKAREERLPLRVSLKLGNKRDTIHVHLDQLLYAALTRAPAAAGQWRITRGRIDFGGQPLPHLDTDGLVLRGRLPQWALQEWLALDGAQEEGDTFLPELAAVDLAVDELYGWGITLHQLRLEGRPRNGGFAVQLAARELNGELHWTTQGKRKVYLHLKEASFAPDGRPPRTAAQPVASRRLELPSLDVRIDQLAWRDRPLGKLELHVSQQGQQVLLDQLRLSHADAVLQANGKWDMDAAQSHLNATVKLLDGGKALQRAGYADALKGGRGELNFDLLWPGGPGEFAWGELSGSVRVKLGKGQFLKLKPGAGKLLSVLNLQALPRRVTLDFTDVFSSGFEFDEIEGEARIEQGLLSTRDFRIEGSPALVLMSGQVDLMRETQNLRLRIAPKVGNTVSLLSFTAGPVVGAGVLLANKLLDDPLDKLASFEYNVKGSWADPAVEKIEAGKAPPQSPEKPEK